MNQKTKSIIITILFTVLLAGGAALCLTKPSAIFSESERRELASFPALSADTLLSGEFGTNFETYATERFPFRDFFRSVKAFVSTELFGKRDNNGLFEADGHISKLDAVENPAMTDHAAKRFQFLYDTYLKEANTKVYLSIIPDKNMFLAEKNGYPALNYESFIQAFRDKTPYMQYIDIVPLLDADDYYATDSHWRQEKITDIAETLGAAMGTDVAADYQVNTLDAPFYGVYHGQLAKPFAPDTLSYLSNEALDNASVYYYDTGAPKEGPLYNMEKAYGRDPYEMFLSGSMPLVTIHNPGAKTDKKLIMFRDSYSSSLAPLLSAGYQTVTLVDIRYMQSAFVGQLIDFTDADVLFCYGTTLLNNSLAMR
ncbi:MAG: hypothetical protein E7402_00865 [Ruminococcaceae bacterium]|nr:hypothetical protein [Oscillospiraceae bacterium]